MQIFDSIILGIVQGLTEFIPVSSSGHLIIVRDEFGLTVGANELIFDVYVHVATLLAVIIYFRKDIWVLVKDFFRLFAGKGDQKNKKMIYALILGTMPAAFLGYYFESSIELIFRNLIGVVIALIAGSILMMLAEYFYSRLKRSEVTVSKGFIIGFFQASALMPGISRSGASISGGMLLGLSREKATRFAFLLSIPILIGAAIFKLGGAEASNFNFFSLDILLGGAAAFISGYFAINFLIKFLQKNSLKTFIWYRLLLAAILIVLL